MKLKIIVLQLNIFITIKDLEIAEQLHIYRKLKTRKKNPAKKER